jgi:hypothetical protein
MKYEEFTDKETVTWYFTCFYSYIKKPELDASPCFNPVTKIFFLLYLYTTLIVYFGKIVNMISIHVPHKNK